MLKYIYNVIILCIYLQNAIDGVINQVNFSDIIKQLENVTENANKFLFKINGISISLNEALNKFVEGYGSLSDANLEGFSKRCVKKNQIDYFKSYSDGSECNQECKSFITKYFDGYKETKGKNYNDLITSVELLYNQTLAFEPVDNEFHPYLIYKGFAENYKDTITDVTGDNNQNQIISFFCYLFCYYFRVLN